MKKKLSRILQGRIPMRMCRSTWKQFLPSLRSSSTSLIPRLSWRSRLSKQDSWSQEGKFLCGCCFQILTPASTPTSSRSTLKRFWTGCKWFWIILYRERRPAIEWIKLIQGTQSKQAVLQTQHQLGRWFVKEFEVKLTTLAATKICSPVFEILLNF